MRVALAPVGTRGDVQPMVALGQRLRGAGHDVTMAVAENFRGLVEGAGLDYVRGGRDVESEVRARGEGMMNPVALFEITKSLVDEQLTMLDAACEGADVLVGSLLLTTGPTLAARRGIPLCITSYFPSGFPSAEHPAPMMSMATAPAWVNEASWAVQGVLTNIAMRGAINKRRAELGVAPVDDVQRHVVESAVPILATDIELAPPPSIWASRVHTTGFWFLDSATSLPPALEAFLEAGEPPVYISFGSMPNDDPAMRTEILVEACRTVSCRAVIGSGWGGLGGGATPPHVMTVGPVNHALLFDRVAAVVHHGGAGTTAAAARAGVPQIVVPHYFDQFYWADRVHALGLGPAPLGRAFQTGALVTALRAALEDQVVKERAQRMSRRLRAYSGADRAVALLEKVVAGVIK